MFVHVSFRSLVVLALGGSAWAQGSFSLTVAIKEGDAVAGVGNVTSIDTVSINDSGTWFVESDTDFADTNFDSVVLRGGVLVAREGDALTLPAGANIDSFGSGGARIANDGHWAWNYFLGNMTTSTDSGIFFDLTPVISESDASTAPQFTAGTPYIGFFGAKLNNSNQIAIMASIDDTAISSTVDRAIVIANISASGVLLSESVVAKEGDILPGQTEAIADFATGPHGWDFNDAGQALYIADLAGATTADGVVVLGTTVLAQEGAASPVVGRTWNSLSTSQRVALNDAGDYAFTGTLSGSTTDDAVLIVNGAVFAQEGSSVAGIPAGFVLQGFGTGPIELDDAGNVFWFGDWNDPDTTRDTGIFRNGQLLVQEGVTQIGALTVTSIASVQENLSISNDGRYLIFEGELTGGLSGAFVLEFAGATVYCTAGTTTNGCNASISGTGTPSASAAGPFTVQVNALEGQKQGLIFYGINGPQAVSWGTGTSFLCVKPPTQRTPVQSSGGTAGVCNGTLSLDWNSFVAANPGALGAPFSAGQALNFQGWFRDPPAPKTTNLSNALSVTVAP